MSHPVSLSEEAVARYRAECGVSPERAYLNHGRISPYPRPTLDAFRAATEAEFSQQWQRKTEAQSLDEARRALATLLDAGHDEIAITQSASYSTNALIDGLSWRAGDNVVWVDLDYRSTEQVLARLRDEQGVELRMVRAEGWLLDPQAVLDAVDERTRLVIVPMLPTHCGVRQPVEEIGRRLSATPALFAVNATQAVGQIPVSVRDIQCDFLFGTSRKWLRGPRGLGFLFIKRAHIDSLRPKNLGYPVLMPVDGRTAESGAGIDHFHCGDYPYPALLALGASVRYANEVGPAAIATRNRELGRLCRERLGAIDKVILYDAKEGVTGSVPCNVRGMDAEAVVQALAARGVMVGSLDTNTGRHVFERLGIPALVRVTIHYYNTPQEVVRLARALEEIAGS